MLHFNELPFRKFFEAVDGVTSGPRQLSGEIGSQLHGEVQKYPIVKFIQVPGRVAPISQDILKDLSTDQLYLYKACLAIQGGPELSDMSFASKRIGPLNRSRWLTLANRTLRLYMSSREPSINLTRIVNYVLNIYAPMWFRVKSNPYCTDGSHNLFYYITLTRFLSPTDKQIIYPVIQRNGFFAYPENILLAAITDQNKSIREYASSKIIYARKSFSKDSQIRQFVLLVPKINFQAENYEISFLVMILRRIFYLKFSDFPNQMDILYRGKD